MNETRPALAVDVCLAQALALSVRGGDDEEDEQQCVMHRVVPPFADACRSMSRVVTPSGKIVTRFRRWPALSQTACSLPDGRLAAYGWGRITVASRWDKKSDSRQVYNLPSELSLSNNRILWMGSKTSFSVCSSSSCGKAECSSNSLRFVTLTSDTSSMFLTIQHLPLDSTNVRLKEAQEPPSSATAAAVPTLELRSSLTEWVTPKIESFIPAQPNCSNKWCRTQCSYSPAYSVIDVTIFGMENVLAPDHLKSIRAAYGEDCTEMMCILCRFAVVLFPIPGKQRRSEGRLLPTPIIVPELSFSAASKVCGVAEDYPERCFRGFQQASGALAPLIASSSSSCDSSSDIACHDGNDVYQVNLQTGVTICVTRCVFQFANAPVIDVRALGFDRQVAISDAAKPTSLRIARIDGLQSFVVRTVVVAGWQPHTGFSFFGPLRDGTFVLQDQSPSVLKVMQ